MTDVTVADPDEHLGLPGWVYSNSGFFAAERERVLAPSWQVVCHLNDIPRSAISTPSEFIDESIFVVRGHDGVPRAFSNVCLHRAATLLDGPAGQCGRIVCPYHAWTYDLEGRLVGVPLRETYPDLRLDERRLPPIELEVFKGFIFVRLEARRAQRGRDDGTLRGRTRTLPLRSAATLRPRDAPNPDRQLEDHRRQLFRWPAHHRGSSGPGPAVRSRLRFRGRALGGQDVGPAARRAVRQSI